MPTPIPSQQTARAQTATQAESAPYNYRHFKASEYALDHFDGPEVGQPAVDFAALDLRGHTVRLSDFRGQIVVLETGSITCPQYVRRIAPMNRLAARHPDVAFLPLYVREAHPGRHIGQHHSLTEKYMLAQRLAQAEDEKRAILVDNLDGTAHRAYGGLPNVVYVLDAAGRVAFRGDWNTPRVIDQVLTRLRAGDTVRDLQAGFAPVEPWVLVRVLKRAGWDALWDFLVSLPNLIGQHITVARKRRAA